MIYVVQKLEIEDYHVHRVWDCPYDDVKERLAKFLLDKAESLDTVINPHYFNIMDHKKFHPEDSDEVYKGKEKQWNKFLKQWNFDKFISEKCKGVKKEFKSVIR